jgi:hypothetical protein
MVSTGMEIFVVCSMMYQSRIPLQHTIGHTTKISIPVMTMFYYAQQFLKIHMHILY